MCGGQAWLIVVIFWHGFHGLHGFWLGGIQLHPFGYMPRHLKRGITGRNITVMVRRIDTYQGFKRLKVKGERSNASLRLCPASSIFGFPHHCRYLNVFTDDPGLKSLSQTRLPQNAICGVSGFNLLIDHETNSRNWAIPYLMVTLSLPFKVTTYLTQIFLQCFGVISHFG